MSITAIALASDYAKLQQLVETSDELTPEMIADTLEGIEGALGDKFDAAYTYVRNLEGMAKTVDEEVKRLADRKKSFENRAKSIRQYVLTCLLASGQDKLKTVANTFTARKGSVSVVIDNVDLLPDELVAVQTLVAPDKKAIKEAIESGVDVKGAHIEIGERTLQVR
ncbi:siphovirus Gp157 family protein [Serratia fonticola]|uniref:siphovirus Gp157 family protein n=1 Tax=Serratia fonticola TaxID=47917 RepID=UPI0003FF10A7|nr:siphovirus Gp157 family protein [Serratia fonticola]